MDDPAEPKAVVDSETPADVEEAGADLFTIENLTDSQREELKREVKTVFGGLMKALEPTAREAKTAIDSETFARMERAGGVSLADSHRQDIQGNIGVYEQWSLWRNESGKEGERLENLERALSDLIKALEAIRPGPVELRVLLRTDFDHRVEIPRLKKALERCTKELKPFRSRGRKANDYLETLLDGLWEVYSDAGGKLTGVSNKITDDAHDAKYQAHSPFTDFAWECISKLPNRPNFKPNSRGALATTWKRRWQRRDKTEPTE
jgi:hypothetical protein